MVEIDTRIHDRYSIELKVGFVTRKKLRMNDFSLAMWFFVPGSLDITGATYPKEMFYQDVKSNIRLITPVFLLREIVEGPAVPLRNIRKAFTAMASSPTRTLISEYEYNIKMFGAIVKSALRDEFAHIRQNRIDSDTEALCEGFITNAGKICDEYAGLRAVINAPTVPDNVMRMYLSGDEFLCDVVCKHILELIEWLRGRKSDELAGKAAGLYRKIGKHMRQLGYPEVRKDDRLHNRIFVHRFSILKKYIESDLYLRAPKRRDGVIVEQLYFSIAAGVAMLFATVVSFAFQRKFGSLTLPLFIALIISYMLKDRIKELMRYYFAHRVGSRYFDNKARIIHKETELGWLKEGVDFIEPEKVPADVMTLRNSSHLTDVESSNVTAEKIILYRKSVHIDRERLQANSEYSFSGINDIIRLNVINFIKKMDDPTVLMRTLGDDGSVQTIECDRDYYLNLVLQYRYDDTTEFKRFRIDLSRDGIKSIDEVR